ncbi:MULTISPECIES: AAA family ATPase [Campylobacter]|uniref:AAA family ATPase n=1 Tax=Campylobacter TaxID=194 RepID=UPI000F8154C0|nr:MULTISPECIES: AAA family ATPase [Campylobacter]RTJ39393.1 endonuclease [Campylobacter jejuni]RTJ52248.1 endonuclease [Campylobacter jejuni]RTJ55002.1 endonuclease [Campylobacter jejuni]RTJ77872.1 endonuclease [Campylobacter jejuni]RTK17670.1 endonuclease [Campylobacter jejuni]
MNTSLNEEQKKNIENKFLEFQRIWTLEKVESMTLEEYTSIKKDNQDRNDFTFWIENILDDIGSIWGGSSFKFGIYKRNSNDDKENLKGKIYNDNYAWLSKYGNNQDEAFDKIKQTIIDIIQASKNNDLETIENIDFGDAIKWKIAFHYQDVNNIKIVNIFSKNVLGLISLNEFKEKLKTYQIYEKLLENKNLSLIKMVENLSIPLWFQYREKYTNKILDLFKKYLEDISKDNDSKLKEDTIKTYIKDIEKISSCLKNNNLLNCNSIDDFLYCKQQIENNEKFNKINDNVKRRYIGVLNHYYNFLNNYFKKNKLNPPLNQILYGPPGTGKTYHTIDKALEILGENLESRDDKKAKFDEYVRKGQIVFTTFHQSYGYEEFVEGIKPDLDKENENSQIRYKIKDGIFKKLCKKALYKEQKLKNDTLISNYSSVWKISLGYNASLREECFKENKICIGWNEIPKNMGDEFLKLGNNDKNTINSFKNEMQLGDLVCVFNSLKTIKGIGIIKSDVKYTQQGEYQTYREVEWISKDDEVNIYELNDNINLTQKTVYKLWRISPNILLDKISNVKNLELIQDNTKEPFIIIIDEINRGNVSKIFGELITLIEPSKRIGEKEELKVTLPYSGEKFGVPKNVYIIGTMNTADRSITSLDTALRRRFEFVEMMPDVSKLSMDCEGINLQELLKAINTRIEYLLDREKTIGHAFFIGVENLNDLKSIFQNKIIPLLQEYFYNDYALINEVLNDNGMIFEDKKDDKYLQKIKNLDSINSERSIYNIASFDDKIWDKIEIYQAIYNDEIANKLKNENE